MNFLQPIWLYAITGIIIPIAIHFWNIKEGKAFPVGSIALLEKSTKQYTRTIRITEWLLLLLRCLLIIALAMLLAKPVKQQNFTNSKGWILLDDQNTKAVYDKFKPVIDSLLKAGYALHRFDEGFKETNIKDALASTDTAINQKPYWQLIKKADNKLPPSFPVYVFTTGFLKNFTGERPQVNAAVKWFVYTADTSIKQITKAWLTNEHTIRTMLANSTPQGNSFSYEDIPANPQSSGAYSITSNNNRLFVAYNDQQPVVVDTGLLHITIYAGKNRQDANYIKGALDAIATFTKQNIQVTISNTIEALPEKTRWLFWLDDDAISKEITAENIFRYEAGKEAAATSFMQANDITEQPVTINKRIIADSVHSTSPVLWKDGFGNALLSKENNNGVIVYHFYSRFNPQWNDLVWKESFPLVLLHLLFETEMNNINNAYTDVRSIDPQQIQPEFVRNNKKITASATEDLATVFWIIIFLMFCAERIISLSTKTTIAA